MRSYHHKLVLLLTAAAILVAGPAASAQLSSSANLNQPWQDLATSGEAKVTLAILKLAETPKETVAFLKQNLHAVKADPERVAKLIAQLDDNQFAVRQKAAQELEYLGKYIQEDLQKAVKGKLQAEAKQKVQQLLDKLPKPIKDKKPPRQARPGVNRVAVINGRVFINGVEVNKRPPVSSTPVGPPMTWVRAARAIAVLEHIGTPEAVQIIESLAKGEADALPTKEAQAALDRLKKR